MRYVAILRGCVLQLIFSVMQVMYNLMLFACPRLYVLVIVVPSSLVVATFRAMIIMWIKLSIGKPLA